MCLLMIYKILTVKIQLEIYYSPKNIKYATREQEEREYIDQHILEEEKTRRKSLAMHGLTTKMRTI